MISATGVEDQELAVGSVGGGVDNPPVAGGRDLRAGAGGDRNPPLVTTMAVRSPEIAGLDAVDRHRQLSLGRRERHGGPKAAGIVKGGEAGVAGGAALLARPAGG